MSGHSRWSQIKHKKALADAKKGAIFGKLARAISVAARGNPDPATNLRLKAEIDRAHAFNMPGENITRAISRVSDADAVALSEIQLELIGPGGAAILVLAITDNSNRTVNELRQLALKHDAHMASQGSLLWMFRRAGVIRLSPDAGEDAQFAAIDAGADDVRDEDGGIIVTTKPEHLERVRSALGSAVVASGIEFIPTTQVPVNDPSVQRKLEALLDALDGHEDVQEVFTNADSA